MRERKDYVVITFHTTTEAMSMEHKCGQQNIPGRLIPVPTQITAGCGLAWRILPEDYEEWKEKIEDLGINFEKVVTVKI